MIDKIERVKLRPSKLPHIAVTMMMRMDQEGLPTLLLLPLYQSKADIPDMCVALSGRNRGELLATRALAIVALSAEAALLLSSQPIPPWHFCNLHAYICLLAHLSLASNGCVSIAVQPVLISGGTCRLRSTDRDVTPIRHNPNSKDYRIRGVIRENMG